MWRLNSPFSPWVLPLRLLGGAALIGAFLRLFVAPDLMVIAIALTGAILWQSGTVARERSPLFRRLEGTALRDIMRTRHIRAPYWTSVSGFQRDHPELDSDCFVITTEHRYDMGIAAPEDIYATAAGGSSFAALGPLGHPISYGDALHVNDSVLAAFLRFRATGLEFLPVLDEREVLAGVVRSRDVDVWAHRPAATRRRVRNAVSKRDCAAEQKLAA